MSFEAPRDGGDPGWSERPGLDRFRHGHAPDGVSALRRVRLRPAGAIGILGARAGLALSGAEGTVGIRITTGSTRHCARFGPETVVRDQPGVFFAKNATAAGLTDCSDASLAAPSPSPSPAPSPSPSPGVCGDGAIDGETETCDGAALGICGDFGLSCGSPGFSNECDCCSPNGEFVSTVGCCNPSSVAISTPAGGGFCFPLRCDPPFGCGSSSECLDDGQCCGRAGNPCAFTLTEPSIALQPCCAGSECGRADQFFLYCCDSAGTACTDDAECCSSSCNAGGVCDP